MMRSGIRKLFTRPARKAPRGFRTVLEVLEDRRVLSSIVVTPIGSGFSYPFGVAVDAAGDVFVANTGNNAVKEVLPNGTITPIGSGFSTPEGVAVDAAGDVFVANYGNSAVKEVLPNGTITPTGSGFSSPQGVAVDAAGDVFVADAENNRAVELSPQATTTTTTAVASSLNPSNYGQSVTFTATVTPGTGTFDNGGTVQFAINGTSTVRRCRSAAAAPPSATRPSLPAERRTALRPPTVATPISPAAPAP